MKLRDPGAWLKLGPMICPKCQNDTWNFSTRKCQTPTCPMGKYVEISKGENKPKVYGQVVGLSGTSYVVRIGGTDMTRVVPSWEISWHPVITGHAKSKNQNLEPLDTNPSVGKWSGAPWSCHECTQQNRRMNTFCWKCGAPRRPGVFDRVIMGKFVDPVGGWIQRQIELSNFVCSTPQRQLFSPAIWPEKVSDQLPGVMDHFLQCVRLDLMAHLSLASNKATVLEALSSPLLKDLSPNTYPSKGPLLVWRFFDGSNVGLMSSHELDETFHGKQATFRKVQLGEKPGVVASGTSTNAYRVDERLKYKYGKPKLSGGHMVSRPEPLEFKGSAKSISISGGSPSLLKSSLGVPSSSGSLSLRKSTKSVSSSGGPQSLLKSSFSASSSSSSSGNNNNALLQSHHQQGIKVHGGLKSDLVSLTCSLPNLVHCTAGDFPCIPGGQVVPMMFGGRAVFPPNLAQLAQDTTYAPFLGLFLISEPEYSIDWAQSTVDKDNNDKLVSYFEREVVFLTRQGLQPFRMETHLVLLYVNPFWSVVTKK